jgi:hypothetical protein
MSARYVFQCIVLLLEGTARKMKNHDVGEGLGCWKSCIPCLRGVDCISASYVWTIAPVDCVLAHRTLLIFERGEQAHDGPSKNIAPHEASWDRYEKEGRDHTWIGMCNLNHFFELHRGKSLSKWSRCADHPFVFLCQHHSYISMQGMCPQLFGFQDGIEGMEGIDQNRESVCRVGSEMMHRKEDTEKSTHVRYTYGAGCKLYLSDNGMKRKTCPPCNQKTKHCMEEQVSSITYVRRNSRS